MAATAPIKAVKGGYDLAGFVAALGDVPVEDDPKILHRKSRDFFWFSPILKTQLQGSLPMWWSYRVTKRTCYGPRVQQRAIAFQSRSVGVAPAITVNACQSKAASS